MAATKKRKPKPLTDWDKCKKPGRTAYEDWPGCDNCWVSVCGHSRLMTPNPDWRKSVGGHRVGICKYEHCIEMQPHEKRPSKRSCPIFGHNCPGGTEQAIACSKRWD